ncbi:hypothetical protein CD351_14940 [Erythrobacter sp. KY5]|uniref:hypothetical protein n=1 Tax=Erythrobacter sp. KY5 TaxID=2011159 RepID=UPI000DBF13A2|nr:hypothetical protein [Erythrobacter sp. KY5]AWW75727.1 hypothetical protein CD351_14940 [Erythrobacter sp. KY5]
MDAFLLAMILTFVIAFGGREQSIVALFSSQLDRNVPLLLIAGACAVVSAVVMAYAGSSIAAILPRRAAEMLVAFALAIAAFELAWPVKLKRMKEPTRSYVAIGAVLIFRQIGDAARFVVFALAAWAIYPTTALLGGAMGGVAAVGLGWALGLDKLERFPLRAMRLALSVCLFLAALMIGLNARYVFL